MVCTFPHEIIAFSFIWLDVGFVEISCANSHDLSFWGIQQGCCFVFFLARTGV
ncbi:hypothetical protein Fmac_000675 [Flemingia macrophylla]|uniref:Uncharacterized protein n=1 Tax=Flemingia macrophylla TaxID=520843 RepID=A0ABD1NEX4_9FABA